MFYLDKRIQGICDELRKLSIRQRVPISGWMYKKGNFIHPEDARHDAAAFSPFDCRNMHWYGPDEHYWFYSDTTVPESFQGKPLWMHVCTQIDEWDDGKNPQFLLFVNGEIVQGIDMNHRDVLLSRSAEASQPLCLELQAYTGTLHTEFNLIVEFREIDPEIEGLYWDLQVPLQAFPRLEAESQSRMDLERVMNDAVNLLDLRTPYSPAFEKSVHEARAYLQKHLYEELGGHDDVIATCIGHTHIDVAWWWTVAQTREKVARSFATVLKLMDEYPHYRFMSSQPQLYLFLKERYPELYARVKERVRGGPLGAGRRHVGGGGLQPDQRRKSGAAVPSRQALLPGGIRRGKPHPLAAGRVRLFRRAAPDHEGMRHRILHDHQAGMEPV